MSDIVNSPSQTKNLECGRAAYVKSGTIVISDPNSPDGGTIIDQTGIGEKFGVTSNRGDEMKVVSVTDDHALVKLTRLELLILNNSLNEVCNGLHISEFHARIGADRSIVRRLLTVVGATLDIVVVNATDSD